MVEYGLSRIGRPIGFTSHVRDIRNYNQKEWCTLTASAARHNLMETHGLHYDPEVAAQAAAEVEEYLGEEVQEGVVAAKVPTEPEADPPRQKRAFRRKKFRSRRRRHGSKVYERNDRPTGANPRERLVLPASAVLGLAPSEFDSDEREAHKEDVDPAAADADDVYFFSSTTSEQDEDEEEDVSPDERLHAEVLEIFEEAGTGVELRGFHAIDEVPRHVVRHRLERPAEVDFDLTDHDQAYATMM